MAGGGTALLAVLNVFFVTALGSRFLLSPILKASGDTLLPDLLLPVQTPLAIRQRGVPPPVLGPRRGHVCELVLLSKQDALILVAHPHQLGDTLADEVEHFADAHEDAQGAGHNHEKHEDLFLCWTADEAVNSVGTRFQRAFGQPTRETKKMVNFKSYSHWLFYSHIFFFPTDFGKSYP